MHLTRNQSVKQILFAFVLTLAAIDSVCAAPIVVGAQIAKVLNIRSPNDASFVVLTQGGSGSCAGQWIYFYPSGASNQEAQKRAYVAVMMALATGMRVDIESADTACENAYAIFTYP